MLSDFDKKLLYEFDFNARTPISQLARKLKVSKQVVSYHLDKLEKEGIIQGYYLDIDPAKLGFNIYLVYLKLNIPEDVLRQFILQLSKGDGVGVNVSCYGKWDYCLGIWAKSIKEFEQYYEGIMKQYEQFVIEKEINIETAFFYYKPLFKNNHEMMTRMHGVDKTRDIDKKDREILSILSKNSRESLLSISEKINLVPNAVKYRIKQLDKEGIIMNYRVMINYEKLGYMHYRVFLKISEIKNEKELISLLGNYQEIISITKTIGTSSIEFRALCKSVIGFIELMQKIKTQLGNSLRSYESIIYTKFHDVLNYYPK